MIIETLKLGCLFILVFIVMRLLGKTLLSQWTAYDLVTIIFLSYSALGAIKVDGFFHAVICIFLIGVLYLVVSRLSLYAGLTSVIVGEPTIIIKHGKIIQKNLKKLRYSLTELLSTVRASGYPDIQDIEYAILEPNGQISVISKENLRPVTPKDLNIEIPYSGLPITVIAEGRIETENLTLIEKNEQWLQNEIKRHGYDKVETIFFAYTKDDAGSLTIFPYA